MSNSERSESRWAGTVHHRGPHGHDHLDHEHRIAVLMVGSGLLRVGVWMALVSLYLLELLHVIPNIGVRTLYSSVAFVALLSVLALLLTDWGQVAASLAQLSAARSHHDSEATLREVGVDYAAIESDIARLAELTPGPDADQLAIDIRKRLKGEA